MNQPLLNRELILEAPERIGDAAGGYVGGWTVMGTLWGEITARTGRERALTGTPTAQVAYKIVVRGAPYGSPERPMPEQRLRHGNRVFHIEAVAERDPEGRYLTCFANEEVVA